MKDFLFAIIVGGLFLTYLTGIVLVAINYPYYFFGSLGTAILFVCFFRRMA